MLGRKKFRMRLAGSTRSLAKQTSFVTAADRFQLANEIKRPSDMFAPYVFISMTIHLRSAACPSSARLMGIRFCANRSAYIKLTPTRAVITIKMSDINPPQPDGAHISRKLKINV